MKSEEELKQSKEFLIDQVNNNFKLLEMRQDSIDN
jgi:hypothetical protein